MPFSSRRGSALRCLSALACRLGLLTLLASCHDYTSGASGSAASPGVSASADELREPPVLSSVDGVLDLLMIAKAAPLPQFGPNSTIGLVYDICHLPSDGSTQCPVVSSNPYGGTRLQVSPGDVLKIHLVNQLPRSPAPSSPGAPGEDFLQLNPTNIHLHGMLVSPRYATADDATWGDNVFLQDFNSANGSPPLGSYLHGPVVFGAVDYRIPIPVDHPSGLYWFHPHLHGITEGQVTAGLSGIITVGQVADYGCVGTCDVPNRIALPARHLILKDTQIRSDGIMQAPLRSDFCGLPGWSTAAAMTPGRGNCEGVDESAAGGPNFSGGHWYFTINGQLYPTLTIGTPVGQLLRIVNASADRTYDLNLWDEAEHRQLLMQLMSVNGVSVAQDVPCTPTDSAVGSVCTGLLHLMPSSRAEVWVTYRDLNGAVATPPVGAEAVLRTDAYQAGPMGDTWPAVDLAQVRFVSEAPSVGTVTVASRTSPPASDPLDLPSSLHASNADVPSDPQCSALPPGHKRRIFLNMTPAFGLGYEEVDGNDIPVPGTFIDVTPFDPSVPTICLPLAPGDEPVTERWELVNLSGSDHNFHLHQARFSLVTPAKLPTTAVPSQLSGRLVLMDSLPLRHADGLCATVADWRNGLCTTYAPTVEVTFSIAGDFVYHCHILAHEDAGMMAVIRVRSAGSASQSVLEQMLSSVGIGTGGPHQPLKPPMQGSFCAIPRQRG